MDATLIVAILYGIVMLGGLYWVECRRRAALTEEERNGEDMWTQLW